MRLTHNKITHLRSLKLLLQKACHAPGCDLVRKCPVQCPCRSQRKFKLNTDTAICWEIAELLWTLSMTNRVHKSYVRMIKNKIAAYAEVTRHHSTEGWNRFFWDVKAAYSVIINEQDTCSYPSSKNRIEDLRRRINRLKRYPK